MLGEKDSWAQRLGRLCQHAREAHEVEIEFFVCEQREVKSVSERLVHPTLLSLKSGIEKLSKLANIGSCEERWNTISEDEVEIALETLRDSISWEFSKINKEIYTF